MKTKLTKTIKSLTCAVLAAAMLFSGTADVQAAKKSTWKTVKLNDSQVDVEYIPYETKTLMELSEDGKTLICTYSPYKADGSVKKSINIKSTIPDDILAQFEDGEVYLYTDEYETFYEKDYNTANNGDYLGRSKQNARAKKAASAYKKKLLKKSKYTNVKVTHYRDFNERFPENSEKGKHSNNEAVEDETEGVYIVTYDELLSSTDGSGKISLSAVLIGCYLADKNGKKIIDIEFETYDYDEYELGVTCNLDELKKHDKNDYDTSYIILKSGKSLSGKLQLTGSCMAGVDYSKVRYDSSILTVKKDGTITAKKGKYGATQLSIGDYNFKYFIYVTDGSSKMFKALNKWLNTYGNYGTVCLLTIGKDGKYTIKETSWD